MLASNPTRNSLNSSASIKYFLWLSSLSIVHTLAQPQVKREAESSHLYVLQPRQHWPLTIILHHTSYIILQCTCSICSRIFFYLDEEKGIFLLFLWPRSLSHKHYTTPIAICSFCFVFLNPVSLEVSLKSRTNTPLYLRSGFILRKSEGMNDEFLDWFIEINLKYSTMRINCSGGDSYSRREISGGGYREEREGGFL